MIDVGFPFRIKSQDWLTIIQGHYTTNLLSEENFVLNYETNSRNVLEVVLNCVFQRFIKASLSRVCLRKRNRFRKKQKIRFNEDVYLFSNRSFTSFVERKFQNHHRTLWVYPYVSDYAL